MAAEATAGNAWVSSYLDALLSYGLSSEYVQAPKEAGSAKAPDADRALYSRYYLKSLLKLDEEALKNAWSKAASATKHGGKDARLQYLSWRIWHLKRRHAQVQRQRRAAESHEEESAFTEPTSAEYSSEEEILPAKALAKPGLPETLPPSGPFDMSAPAKADVAAEARGAATVADVAPTGELAGPRAKGLKEVKIGHTKAERAIDTVFEDYMLSPTDHPTPRAAPDHRLYIIMCSLHGLVRGERMELGKDSDTGGQVKYVVELAKAMALHPSVYRVDLLTRLIRDPEVDPEYGVEEECLAKGVGELGGAYIVRLPCGPTEVYVRKELLWPHVREFADNGVTHANRMLSAMAEAGRRCELHAVHGHYADAGEVAVLMSSSLGVDMVMTGHSLGRNKLEHLLKSGSMTRGEIERTYAINRRIEAEERCLDNAMLVFTSTQQEIDEQWGLYDGYQPELARVLRFRRSSGRSMPLMKVSPPGLDFSSMKVTMPEDPVVKEFEQQKAALQEMEFGPGSPRSSAAPGSAQQTLQQEPSASGSSSQSALVAGDSTSGSPKSVPGTPSRPPAFRTDLSAMGEGPWIWQDIARFLRNPHKPAILAMSRPDTKKNLHTLVKAFGEDPLLREFGNLVLIMGNRDNIDSMGSGVQKVLVGVLKLIDAYDLHGSVAYPKHHQQSEVSDIYLYAHATRGIFCNIALQEPFGLTVIEAAAHGVPCVATQNGGPVDIMQVLHHGVTVDPTDSAAVASAMLKILTDPATWDAHSKSGVDNIMAYSWPSHCKRYLEAVDAEKRFIRSCQRSDRTLSGLLDKRQMALTEHSKAALDVAVPAANPEGLPLERYFSTPYPQKQATGGAAAQGLRGSGPSGVSNDDLAILEHMHHDIPAADLPRAAGKASLVVVPLDSNFCVPDAAAVLRAAQAQLERDGLGGSVALGVLSMLGFDSTRDVLAAAGVDLSRVDCMVCNSGADAWIHLQSGQWESDEQYEALIEFEWDRISLHRMLRKIISHPAENHRRLPRLKELLYNVGEAPQAGVHPRHVCLELDAETQAILTTGMGPRAKGVKGVELAGAVAGRLKRRLRCCGFRATFTLQAVPRDSELVAVLHITPVRASRAFGLRFVAQKLGVAMSSVCVAAPVPAVLGSGVDVTAGSFTGDKADLFAGSQTVLAVTTPPKEDLSFMPEGVLVDSLGVGMQPWLASGERVKMAADLDEFGTQLAASLKTV